MSEGTSLRKRILELAGPARLLHGRGVAWRIRARRGFGWCEGRNRSEVQLDHAVAIERNRDGLFTMVFQHDAEDERLGSARTPEREWGRPEQVIPVVHLGAARRRADVDGQVRH